MLESRELKWPFQPSGLGSLFYVFRKYCASSLQCVLRRCVFSFFFFTCRRPAQFVGDIPTTFIAGEDPTFEYWEGAGISKDFPAPYRPNNTYTISDIFAVMPRSHARVFMQPLQLQHDVSLESIQGKKVSAMSCSAGTVPAVDGATTTTVPPAVGEHGPWRDCGLFAEDTPIELSCPPETAIAYVNFASWGKTEIHDDKFVKGSCHSDHSWSVVSKQCLGRNSCSVQAANANFGDPCPLQIKSLAVQVTCADQSTALRAQKNFALFEEKTKDNCACSHSQSNDGAPISACDKNWENGYLMCECLPKTALISHGIPFKLFPFMAKIRRSYDFCKRNSNYNAFNTIC